MPADGWEILTTGDKPSGFFAAAIRQKSTGDLVFTFRQAEPQQGDIGDITSVLASGFPSTSAFASQFDDAREFVNQVLSNEGFNILAGTPIFTAGFSLGGGLAQVAANEIFLNFGTLAATTQAVTFGAVGAKGFLDG